MYNSRRVPTIKGNVMDYHSDHENLDDLEYGDYEDIGTPLPAKGSWLARKIGKIRLGQVKQVFIKLFNQYLWFRVDQETFAQVTIITV